MFSCQILDFVTIGIILGVLHRGDFHPYEIKRRVTNAMIDCYTDVDVGTLYYAVRRLAKDGLIAPVARERVARGGIRTVYGITAKGKQRFQELLLEQFEAEGSVAETMYGAKLFLHLADLAAVEDLLTKKLERQNELIHKLEQIQKKIAPSLSTGGLHLLRHLSLQRQLDRKWLKALLADVAAGRVRDVPDPKKLAAPGRLASLE